MIYRECQSSPLIIKFSNELIPEDVINDPINPYLLQLQIFLVGAGGTKEQKRGNNEQERLIIMILEVDCLVGI
jgi:hypothetical protein